MLWFVLVAVVAVALLAFPRKTRLELPEVDGGASDRK